MNILDSIAKGVVEGVKTLYGQEVAAEKVALSPTRKEFEGDYTVVVFPYTKAARKKPVDIGEELGTYLFANLPNISGYNVINGFLNLSVASTYWTNLLESISANNQYGKKAPNGKKIMIEYSSPNTNKPLHLGHIRNILLGWSSSKIYEAIGYEVIKVQIVNDRGIAICRSMLAWERFSNGETPESTGLKGDHFVGKYYVKFNTEFVKEYETWQQTEVAKGVYEVKKKEGQDEAAFFKAYKNDYFNEYSELGQTAKEMLVQWEANDPKVRALWRKMNGWVLGGFDETYEKLGVTFDKLYFESDTYLLGKELIEKGLAEDVMQKDGKRVWADLSNIGMEKKTILKSDGTSTYTSQDLGTAQMRYNDYGAEKVVYVVGDEQIAHFQGVFELLKRLEEPYADGLYHLAYGMVDLPTGRMKSREGTVVDADDLVAEVIQEAKAGIMERGEVADLPVEEQEAMSRKVGLGALKYFILKVNPRKRMVFNPQESVELQGNTGPYIQYSYVRCSGVARKAPDINMSASTDYTDLQPQEKDLILKLFQFPDLIEDAAKDYDPSIIAAFAYDLAKGYHKFYHDINILKSENEAAMAFRLKLSQVVARTLATAMDLLGIEMPARM
ncbi:MAG: arginine--tRNA ligase [Bacteroidota bacterium]